MHSLWEGVKATAGIVGQAAVQTGKLGKLQTELLLINREIENRKRAFGEELYEYVVRACVRGVFHSKL
jgi:Glu-tRNA(Gln) amidotransferase subunit E-like FAD-binding protein